MGYVDDTTVTALRKGTNLGVFLRIAVEPDPLLLCLGINDIPIGIESVDAGGSVYIGSGKLLGIPELEVLINGLADRVEFSVSGVSAEHVAQLAPEAAKVKGKPVHVGIAVLDARWQPTTQIIPLWKGYADFWSVQRKPKAGTEGNPTQTIAISVGTGDTARSRSRRSYWTKAQQQKISPTDEFCSRVARYTRDYEVAWPRF